jgi:ABC-type nitrate/sulfonate/bicarbonate transport system substrate-binding protein
MKFLRCLSVLGAVLISLASSATLKANAAEKIRVAFPTTPTTAWLPLYVAQKQGWLGDLEVEEIYVTGDSNAIRAVLSGNADYGAGIGTFGVLTAIDAGSDLRAISSWSPLPDYNVVIAADKGKTIADLAGKVIATSGPGALPDQLPRILMRKHGVDPSTARFIQVGGHPARLQAVLGGRADATLVNTITGLDAIQKGRVNLVAKIADEFPKLGYVWNVARVSAIEDPKTATQFQILTTAGIKGSRFIMEHPDEAAEILHARVPDIDLDLAKRVIRDLNADKVWGTSGGLNLEIAEFTAKTGADLGVLKNAIPPSTLLYPRFVDTAMKELGPEK